MELDTAVNGVLHERHALQQPEGVSTPTFISEHMQRLSQYVSVLEEILSYLESDLEKLEAKLFNQYRAEGKTVNASQTQIKYDVADEHSEVVRLTRLTSSSWKLIGVSQSRVKHLVEESKNQI